MLESKVFRIDGAPGRDGGLYGIAREITRRCEYEESLVRNQAEILTLVESNPDAMLVLDDEHQIRFANRKAEELFQRPGTDLIGKPFGLPITDRESTEVQVPRPGGEGFICEMRLVEIEWEGRNAKLVILRDVTLLRRTEEEKVRLAAAIDQASNMVVITDTAGSILYVNPAFEKTTGYSRNEVVGKNPRILKSGRRDEAFYRELWDRICSGKTWQGRMVNRKKDGSLYTEEASISPVRDPQGGIVAFVAVKSDITDRIEREKQLRESFKLNAVGKLAGGVAHDFNNMLQTILGHADIALDRIEDGRDCREDLCAIQQAAERSADLSRQLLTFSRKRVLSKKVLDLNRRVNDLLKMIRRTIPENIEVDFRPAPVDCLLEADPSNIDQTLMNLCLNARDALPGGGRIGIETARVTLEREQARLMKNLDPGDYVLLRVTDNGCGMSEDDQGRIFEPFYTTKEVGKGTGLGLSTVYGIVEQHGGGVFVESRLGKGTRFSLYFPVYESGAESAEEKTDEVIPGGTEKVLIVEDESPVRRVLKVMLESAGYTVLEADHGVRALEILNELGEPVPLAVVDVIMPKMGGRELCERIRSEFPRTRVLFASGYSPEALPGGMAPGSETPLVSKPFRREQLLRMVRRVLDDKA